MHLALVVSLARYREDALDVRAAGWFLKRCEPDNGGSLHGHTDKGRVERGIERELYFTEPPDFHIFLLYPPLSPVD
jgi:hypothetical protein